MAQDRPSLSFENSEYEEPLRILSQRIRHAVDSLQDREHHDAYHDLLSEMREVDLAALAFGGRLGTFWEQLREVASLPARTD